MVSPASPLSLASPASSPSVVSSASSLPVSSESDSSSLASDSWESSSPSSLSDASGSALSSASEVSETSVTVSVDTAVSCETAASSEGESSAANALIGIMLTHIMTAISNESARLPVFLNNFMNSLPFFASLSDAKYPAAGLAWHHFDRWAGKPRRTYQWEKAVSRFPSPALMREMTL